jgi:ribosome-binding protein aMBF1 (putative translation factor)
MLAGPASGLPAVQTLVTIRLAVVTVNRGSVREDLVKTTDSGAVVRRARLAQGLTLSQLGQRIGYSASQVSRFERGRVPLSDVNLLRRIAVLGTFARRVGISV